VAYTPNAYITLLGGKMDNPMWEPATLLWDPDITPEGGAIKLEKKLNDYVTPFATEGVFILKDQAPSSSIRTMPYVMASQAGIKGNLTEKAYYKVAATYYDVHDPAHLVLDNSLSTNLNGTNAGAAQYGYGHHPIVGSIDLGMNDPFGELLPSPLYVPQIGVFGQYLRNPNAPSHMNAGWQMGAYMGNSSINGFGTWKLQSYYRVLERESWLDAFTDDDFYSGDVNTAGMRSQLDIGLAKNVWFTLSYFNTHIFKTNDTVAGSDIAAFSQKAPESLFQADLNFKF
jgi:hypothetical protein